MRQTSPLIGYLVVCQNIEFTVTYTANLHGRQPLLGMEVLASLVMQRATFLVYSDPRAPTRLGTAVR